MIIRDTKELRGNRVIWKYLSWDKFFDLLITKELYMAKVSDMTDKNECYISQMNIERINDYANLLPQSMTPSLLTDDSIKERSFIDCWTLSRNESYALWKIYLSNTKSGVAIKTTIRRLEKAIKENLPSEDIHIRMVHYGSANIINKIDLSKATQEHIDLFRLTTKLKAYQYENEVRLICFSNSEQENKRIKISSLDFIDEIYFSPFNACFDKTYHEVLKKIDGSLENKVKKSSINDQ